jgi:mono/diheme cytochrome c family protein
VSYFCLMRRFVYRIVTLIGLMGALGCNGSESPKPKPQPTSIQTPAVVETPGPSPDRKEPESSGSASGRGMSGSAGENATSEGSSGGRTGSNFTGSPNSETELSPAEYRTAHFEPRPFSAFEDLDGYEEVRTLSVQPANSSNVNSGQLLYEKACLYCHNLDGSPVRRDAALIRFNMADLSRPQQYKYGSTPKSIYRSIAYGVPAPPMGPSKEIYTTQQMWDLVNYVQSLQK